MWFPYMILLGQNLLGNMSCPNVACPNKSMIFPVRCCRPIRYLLKTFIPLQGFLNWACLPRRRRNSNRAAILLDAPTYEQALELDVGHPLSRLSKLAGRMRFASLEGNDPTKAYQQNSEC